jgi:hypothetical protein
LPIADKRGVGREVKGRGLFGRRARCLVDAVVYIASNIVTPSNITSLLRLRRLLAMAACTLLYSAE